MAKSTALAIPDTFKALGPVIEDEDALFSTDELQDSMGAEGFGPGDLERIKVPAGGSTTFEIGDDAAKSIDVVIVGAQDIRMFYNSKYTGGNEPPDCISLDLRMGVVGEDAPAEITGECATCPKAQWGSAKDDDGNPTAGQACSQRKVMLIYRPEDSFPFILSAPSSSLKNIKQYFGRLVSGHGRPFWGVVTRFTLEKKKSGSGIEYSVLAPEYLRDLTEDEVVAVKQIRARMLPALERRTPEGADAE